MVARIVSCPKCGAGIDVANQQLYLAIGLRNIHCPWRKRRTQSMRWKRACERFWNQCSTHNRVPAIHMTTRKATTKTNHISADTKCLNRPGPAVNRGKTGMVKKYSLKYKPESKVRAVGEQYIKVTHLNTKGCRRLAAEFSYLCSFG